MTLEEMKQRKKELGYTYARLSELSGVPLSTVQKIFGGATTAPRYDTMLALESLLVPAPSQTASASADTASHPGSYEQHAAAFSEEELSHAGQVGESGASYQVKRQGEYTLTDYYQIPHRAATTSSLPVSFTHGFSHTSVPERAPVSP